MKKVVVIMVCLVLAGLLLAVVPVCGEEAVYRDVVRLHVLAASDTAVDQALKLAVRDAVLAQYGEMLGSAADAGAAEEALRTSLGEIEALARRVLQEAGSDASVRVSLERTYFDRRTYGERTLPAGYYRALRIVIGDGQGQNWWCVLYPPLCTEAALGGEEPADAFSPAEEALLCGRYEIRFRCLEWIACTFGQAEPDAEAERN